MDVRVRTRSAVTINVGYGPGCTAARRAGMLDWAARAVKKQPAIVFAQEVDQTWISVWEQAEYRVIWDPTSPWSIRSALITAPDLDVDRLKPAAMPNAAYHGSYVAAGLWSNAPDRPVVLVSVHASPAPVDFRRYPWHGSKPKARHGGGDPRWASGRLWDADCVSATLLATKANHPGFGFIAGGDFNESRLDDFTATGERRGTWGKDYFDRLDEGGLGDMTAIRRAETLPTRAGLQLDHVLADAGTTARLGLGRPRLDRAWRHNPDVLSDHVALWFSLRLYSSRT